MTRSFFVLALSVTLIGAFTPPSQAQEATSAPADHHPHVGEIDAFDHAFRAPDTIPSGWTTFRFTNEGHEEHVFVALLLDEGWTFEDYAAGIVPPVDEIWVAPLKEAVIED